MNKRQEFQRGVAFFANRFCGASRDTYTSLMTRPQSGEVDGYIAAVKIFYQQTGRLTKHEVTALYDNNTLPKFALESYQAVEIHLWGIDLVSYR